ncbi:Yip1 family protein, partial [Streptomyces sp. NPDC127044]
MAGFRIGRGRDDRAPQARPQQHRPSYGQQAPQGGQQPYGYPPAPSQQQPYGGQQYGGGRQHSGGQPGWPQANGGGAGGHGEPEYFGDGHPQQGPDPYAANSPGHTQAFSVGEDPYTQGGTYRAGQAAAPPIGPRLHWKDLLRGIVTAPNHTFLQMRDYTMWAPALIVTFLYGLLAVFGFDGARKDAINATLSNAVPIVLTTAVAIVISTFILGVVTHTLARQLGGDGAWQPTVGLSMLIMSITDTPRLIVAMFFGGDASFVQLLGWATWVAAGARRDPQGHTDPHPPRPKAHAPAAIPQIAI